MKTTSMRGRRTESARVSRRTRWTLAPPLFQSFLALPILLRHAHAEDTTHGIRLAAIGEQANGKSSNPSISADGRYVVFCSVATNLVQGDTNEHGDVFVRDRQRGSTERVSVDSMGAQGNGDSGYSCLSISSNGRYVAFYSCASNLVPGDTNERRDVFVRDRRRGTTQRVSVDSTGAQGDGDSGYFYLTISCEGRYVAFDSSATNFAPRYEDRSPRQENGSPRHEDRSIDFFVRDRHAGTTERMRVDSSSTRGKNRRFHDPSATSVDGRFVVFESCATDLDDGEDRGIIDIFLRDSSIADTERVSVDSIGTRGNGHSSHPSISADGRFVVFQSLATNLVTGDTNGVADIFVRDRQTGTTERVNVASCGDR